MDEVKKEIIKALRLVLSELGIQESSIQLDFPTESSHGDLTSNLAMVTFRQSEFRSPLALAEEIVKRFKIYDVRFKNTVEKVEVAKPGFINFYLSNQYFYDSLRYITKHIDAYGLSEKEKGRKIMVEFTDPNPFKELHIGHLYTNTIGEALSRLFESQGAEVARSNYQGDVGLHVAKALFGLRKKIYDLGFKIEDLEKKPLKERVKVLGDAYAQGSKAYEESEEAKQEINSINKIVYEKDAEIYSLYLKGRAWSLDYFEEVYKRLGTKFRYYYFESEVGPAGAELVKEHIKDGIFQESEGAVIFNGEPFGLHKRVFINSLGLPTYEAKELGLAPKKFSDFPYDESYIITGNEVNEYFKVLIRALSFIDPKLAERTHHIGHGMVTVEGGKMSSRKGSVITAEWLLDTIKKTIQETYPEVDKESLEQITVGSAKYALLKNSIGRNIDFSFHESVALHGNSGPYLQYSYVRTQSILAKSDYKISPNHTLEPVKLTEKEEIDILRHLVKFPLIVSQSAVQRGPHILCLYLFELASLFNLFYQKHPVLKGEAKEERLVLTLVVGEILKKGLGFLGIPVPNKM